MRLNFAAHSHQGMLRHDNQDVYLTLPQHGFFAVADGMGGHQSGALASALIIESLKNNVLKRRINYSSHNLSLPLGNKLKATESWFANSFAYANKLIKIAATKKESYRGLGSTLTAINFDGLAVTVGHMGDSRAYQWRNGTMYQLTSDHNLASELLAKGEITEDELETCPQANVLTKAICANVKSASPDIYTGDFAPGDIFLICSDGLHRPLGDEAIFERLEEGGHLKDMAEDLIEMANHMGGPDNITVVLVRPEE